MDNERPVHTFQTRIEVEQEIFQGLSLYASLMSKVVRCLFSMAMAGKAVISLKNEFLLRFGITARQFNACRVQTEGKIESIRQLNNQRIRDLKERIDKLKKEISRLVKRGGFQTRVYWKRKRIFRLEKKLTRLKEDQAQGRVRLCFGSRKLFREQFNGDKPHDEWKKEWESKRNREFFVLGSKDETAGNQTCTATLEDDGSLTLRLRLPNALNRGKYVEIRNVHFPYGHSVVVAALEECKLRSDLAKQKDPAYKNHGQAISFRFVLDDKGWTVFISTALPLVPQITNEGLGAVGVDINTDHLAIAETDRYGNLVVNESIPLNLYGKTQHQAQAIVGDACARAVEIAAKAKKPLIVEQLDFAKKKRTLKELNPSSARLLSSFAYSAILQTLRSRAYRSGVQLVAVNPAFTSLIGRVKFAAKYGLTTHQAAALCIARRFQRFSEKLPLQSSVPDDRGCHVAFSVPVRNREKHEWQYLRVVAQKLRAAFAKHFRVAKCQSSGPHLSPL